MSCVLPVYEQSASFPSDIYYDYYVIHGYRIRSEDYK